jgi:hypothetical protein
LSARSKDSPRWAHTRAAIPVSARILTGHPLYEDTLVLAFCSGGGPVRKCCLATHFTGEETEAYPGEDLHTVLQLMVELGFETPSSCMGPMRGKKT